MADVKKGVISSVNGDKATVVLGEAKNAVTSDLVIPWDLYEFIKVNDTVVFVQFDDGTGLILSRMDGKRSTKIKGDLQLIDGDLTADDVHTPAIPSLNTHTH